TLFDDIASNIAEATFDKAATLVDQARTTVQQTTPAVSQLAAATITRSW
ncbi:chemotaxis protein, partial [Escherichia coli]